VKLEAIPVRTPGDAFWLSLTIGFVMLVTGVRLYYDNWLADFDMLGFFLPNFGYLGDRLASLELPLWNPHEASGSPTIGNPSAGWLYLPVMLAFPLLEVITAFKVMVLLQCLVAAVATYVFARKLTLHPIAAMVTASAFAGVTVLGAASTNATVYAQALAFVPVTYLGIEGAFQAARRMHLVAWGALGGLGASQVLAAWPGQGTLYVGMLISGWALYRMLFPLADTSSHVRVRWQIAVSTAAVAAFTAATFSASLIVGLLSFSEASTIPGGDYSKVIGGDYTDYTTPFRFLFTLLLKDFVFWRGNMISAALIVLGLYALLVTRGRFGVWCLALSVFVLIDLATTDSFTRGAFYLVPGFERLHSHRPLASVIFALFPLIMLGGIGLDRLIRGNLSPRMRLAILAPVVLFGSTAWHYEREQSWIGWTQVAIAIATAVIVAITAIPRFDRIPGQLRQTVPALALTALVLAYPAVWDVGDVLRDPTSAPDYESLFGRDPNITALLDTSMARVIPGTAAEFLQSKQAQLQPFRYAPFTGYYDGSATSSSTAMRLNLNVMSVLTNGRSMRLDLQQVTGYNPLHLKYYADYIDAMNGRPQDYHWLDLLPGALSGGQLIDMLNVRYVLVPLDAKSRPLLISAENLVYSDQRVSVYENPGVFARAWIVHDVRPALDGEELVLLNSWQVDGHETAFVDGGLPPVSAPDANGAADLVTVTGYHPESITFSTRSAGDGLLVVSESWFEGWNAYVDGEQVDVLRTNHAMRGVPLSAGEHTVVMKYEPRLLTIGLWSTGAASVAMIAIWSWTGVDRGRRTLRDRGSRAR
jgi:hypothetical protein